MTNRLLLDEKIILHLSNYKEFKGTWDAPKAISQNGICNALSISQPQVAKLIKSLIQNRYIEEASAHIQDLPHARKAYYLTTKGILKSNDIKARLKGRQDTPFKPKELLATLSNAIRDLQKIQSTTPDAKVQLEIVSKLQQLYYELGHNLNIDESYRVLELSKDVGRDGDVARAYYYLGRAFTLQSQWDKAVENLQKGLEIADNLNNSELLGEIHLAMGSIYNRIGKLDRVFEHLEHVLDCCKTTENKVLPMRAMIDLGLLHTYRSKYSKAESMLNKAEEIANELKYEGYNLMRLLNNFGILYLFKNDFERAGEYFQRTLALGEKKNSPIATAYALTNSAETYARAKDIDKAKQYCKRAEPVVKYLGNRNLEAGLNRIHGLIHTSEGELDKADKSFSDGIQQLRELKDKYNLSRFLVDYAVLLKKMDRKDEQKAVLEEAMSIMKDIKNKTMAEKIEKELAQF